MKKVLSPKINKEYWLAAEEVEAFEKGGFPIFTPIDIRELKVWNPSKDELLKVWIKKSFEKVSVAAVVEELRRPLEKEKREDLYKRPGIKLSPVAELALQNIKKVLGGSQNEG